MMTTRAYLQKHVKSGKYLKQHNFRELAKRVVCKNGASLSVQASRGHYCAPRNNIGPYRLVEVGYPSRKPPKSWFKYCEDTKHPKQTVYGFVPIELVVDFIDKQGGIRTTN